MEPDKAVLAAEPLRSMRAGAIRIELLPRRCYETSFVPDAPVVGFAFDSQQGRHAFASDRVRPFRTKPNSLAFTPRGCEVFSSSETGGEYLRLIHDHADVFIGDTARQFNDVIQAKASRSAQVIRGALLRNEPASLHVESHAIALVECVLAVFGNNPPEGKSGNCMTAARLRRIDDLIAETIAGEISIRDMATALQLSEGFFLRAFKAAMGTSPHRYVIDKRIAHARALIQYSKHDLRDIALASGFSSHSHMTAVFRERLGVLPGKLRAI